MICRTLVATAFVVFSLGLLQADESLDSSEAKALLRANQGFYAALNSMFQGDLAPMERVWSHADDVAYLGPDGSYRFGWKATLEDWQKQAAMNLGGKIEPQEVHFNVGRDLAVVHCLEVGENMIDGESVDVRLRATNLYRKEAGRWKMIGHHTDRLPYLDE